MSFWKKAGWVGAGVVGASVFQAARSQTKYNKKALELIELEIQERKLALQERQKLGAQESEPALPSGDSANDGLGINTKLLLVDFILGAENADGEMETAIQKDTEERQAFKERLDKVCEDLLASLRTSIESGNAKEGAQSVLKARNDFLTQQQDVFMFKNYPEFEEQYKTTYDAITAIVASQLPEDKRDEFWKTSERMFNQQSYAGLLKFLDLNGKLDTGNKERAWLLVNTQVISDYIAMFKKEDAIKMAGFLRAFMDKSVKSGTLDKDDLEVPEMLIKEGLERNAKFGPLAMTF